MKFEKEDLKNVLGISLFFLGMSLLVYFENSITMRTLGVVLALYGAGLIAKSWSS